MRFPTRTPVFPVLSSPRALQLLRVTVAVLFMAHAVVRILNGTIPRFGAFLETRGFPSGVAVVWLVTLAEITAGSLLILNRYVRAGALVLFTIATTGIVLIHAEAGWFVGEHGTGGSEYSVALMVMLIVVAAHDERLRDKGAPAGPGRP